VTVNQLVDPNDPALRSWVESANDPAGDFPIQNLPYGTLDGGVAVRIGAKALRLRDALDADLLVRKLTDNEDFQYAAHTAWLNGIAELEPEQQSMLRRMSLTSSSVGSWSSASIICSRRGLIMRS
jgi:fumarylacetoacetase